MEPIWQGDSRRNTYRDAHLTIEFAQQAVFLDTTRISLTTKEYALLSFLVANAGEVVGREQVLLAVWGYSSEIRTRTLDVHLARLRKKLGSFGRRHLETICGNGCRFQPPAQVAVMSMSQAS